MEQVQYMIFAMLRSASAVEKCDAREGARKNFSPAQNTSLLHCTINTKEMYVPISSILIKLFLRRTLVQYNFMHQSRR